MHLETVWRQTGKIPQQLEDLPELPELATHVWQYFIDLHGERGNSGMGAGKITSAGLLDWQAVEGIKLKQWEIRAIRLIDNLWMSIAGKWLKKH